MKTCFTLAWKSNAGKALFNNLHNRKTTRIRLRHYDNALRSTQLYTRNANRDLRERKDA